MKLIKKLKRLLGINKYKIVVLEDFDDLWKTGDILTTVNDLFGVNQDMIDICTKKCSDKHRLFVFIDVDGSLKVKIIQVEYLSYVGNLFFMFGDFNKALQILTLDKRFLETGHFKIEPAVFKKIHEVNSLFEEYVTIVINKGDI